jgi:Fe-S-cluster containining protein
VAAHEIDTSLLAGFPFVCRPDCGLCCYAEPLVLPAEKSALIGIVPEAEFVSSEGFEFLRSSPHGGACQLLDAHRCRAHPVRPAPCREYPIVGHLGLRAQATVTLTCPGVDLTSLDGYSGPDGKAAPQGLQSELGALSARVGGTLPRRLEASQRRRSQIARILEKERRWVEEDEVRRQFRGRIPVPGPESYPVIDPPSQEDGMELLPLVFAGLAGPVALASVPDGWELVELRPSGGVRQTLGVAAPPDHPPALTDPARRILLGYLRYWLERDQLFGTVLLEMGQNRVGDVTDYIADELRWIAATAVSRAYVLAAVMRGGGEPLSGDDLYDGIRATDQDLLDRPTWGTRL